MAQDEETLEQEKLRAEIDEIRLRVRDHAVQRRLEKFKVYPTYIAVITTLLVGIVTFALQWSEYLDQREREQRFKIGEEMIKLVMQLNDREFPNLQRSAALELAFFGRPAVPLMLEHLDMQADQDVRDAIVKGLAEVARVEEDAGAVIQPMIASTFNVLDRELADRPLGEAVIKRRFSAFADVAVLLAMTDRDPKPKDKVSETLQSLRQKIQANEALDGERKQTLQGIVDDALQRLNR